jgi:hypothetical protein
MTTDQQIRARLLEIADCDRAEWRTAMHEAAHATVAICLGITVDSVTIEFDSSDLSYGATVIDVDDAPQPMALAMLACAGAMAESRLDREPCNLFDKDSLMFESSIRSVPVVEQHAFRAKAKEQAADILRRNWKTAERMARALVVDKTITKAALSRILAGT